MASDHALKISSSCR